MGREELGPPYHTLPRDGAKASRQDLSVQAQALHTADAHKSFPKGFQGLTPSPMPAALFVFCTKSRRAERYWQKTLLQMEEMESQIREEIRKGSERVGTVQDHGPWFSQLGDGFEIHSPPSASH